MLISKHNALCPFMVGTCDKLCLVNLMSFLLVLKDNIYFSVRRRRLAFSPDKEEKLNPQNS